MTEVRRYWMTMDYACDRCGTRVTFYLEDGCEGPRNGGSESHVVQDGPSKGERRPWPKTASGRLVVPVPFVAAGCPACQPHKPWRLAKGSGVLQHVEWQQDRKFPDAMTPDVPAGCGVFFYPRNPRVPSACGVPVLSGDRVQGEATEEWPT